MTPAEITTRTVKELRSDGVLGAVAAEIVKEFAESVLTMREREREMQLLIPSKRMRFYNAITGETGKTPTFKAAYFAVNLFRESLILQEMDIINYD